MLCCRRGTNCSAAIAVVSPCRHLEPLGDLFPRLVLGACLLSSQCTRSSEKPLGQPGVCCRCLATARSSLRWVDEHGVPRATVLSPTAGVSLAVCPAAAVASSPAGREKPYHVPPSWDVCGVHPQINAGSVLLLSVPMCLLLQAPCRVAAAWTQAQEPGATGNVLGLRQCPCVAETSSPRVQARDCLWGFVSSRHRPDPIPSLALHPFSLALSQGCCQHPALAPGEALTCHCHACACTPGGWRLPPGAWKRLCAIFAWLELDPASCAGAISVFQSVQCSVGHPSAAGIGQGWAHCRQRGVPPSLGDMASPHRALAAHIFVQRLFILSVRQLSCVCWQCFSNAPLEKRIPCAREKCQLCLLRFMMNPEWAYSRLETFSAP